MAGLGNKGSGGIPVNITGTHFKPNLPPGYERDGKQSTQRPDEWWQKQPFGRIERPFRKEETQLLAKRLVW